MKKRRIAKLIAVFSVALSVCVPVYASTITEAEVEPRAQQPYSPYDVTVYSGVTAYTGAGQNYTNNAGITLESVTGSSPTTYFTVATYAYDSTSIISSGSISKPSSGNGILSLGDAAHHPGENIRAGFYKSGFNGSYRLKGKFYYNGF